MSRAIRKRVRAAADRLGRIERREMRDLHRWLEDTRHVLLLSVLLVVPLVMGVLTYFSNALDVLPFLLFPPLASGAYTLFSRPESRSASPRRFVGGLTLGAVSGWLALELTARYLYHVDPAAFTVHPGAAAFGLLLTGVLTWALDLEESQAFSTALLVLVTGANQFIYVASVFVSSVVVAGVFVVWHDQFYRRRAQFLYGTVSTDDHILVPVRGDGHSVEHVAAFAAQLAASHEAGKLVLLDVAPESASAVHAAADGPTDAGVEAVSDRLTHQSRVLEERFGVPCEAVVTAAGEDDSRAVLAVARATNCDLIAVPYATDETEDRISPFLRALFRSDRDVVALRSANGVEDWRRLLVPVRRDGEVAHAMIDFAERLAGDRGSVTVAHCIANERRRSQAESMLATLVDQFERALETRVSKSTIHSFLAENCGHYDLTFIGASTDRSVASRVISPPTFRQIQDLECDFAIVHRG